MIFFPETFQCWHAAPITDSLIICFALFFPYYTLQPGERQSAMST